MSNWQPNHQWERSVKDETEEKEEENVEIDSELLDDVRRALELEAEERAERNLEARETPWIREIEVEEEPDNWPPEPSTPQSPPQEEGDWTDYEDDQYLQYNGPSTSDWRPNQTWDDSQKSVKDEKEEEEVDVEIDHELLDDMRRALALDAEERAERRQEARERPRGAPIRGPAVQREPTNHRWWHNLPEPSNGPPFNRLQRNREPVGIVSALPRKLCSKTFTDPELVMNCVYCDRKHKSDQCPYVVGAEVRKEHLVMDNRCTVCLGRHPADRCHRGTITCFYCETEFATHHYSICEKGVDVEAKEDKNTAKNPHH